MDLIDLVFLVAVMPLWSNGMTRTSMDQYGKVEMMKVHLDGDGAWPDLQAKGYTVGKIESVARIANGTVKGRPAIAFRVRLPNGRVVLAQTTLDLLSTAVKAMETASP